MQQLAVSVIYIITIVMMLTILGVWISFLIMGLISLLKIMGNSKTYDGIKKGLKKMIVIAILVAGLGLILEIFVGHIWHTVSSYRGQENYYYKGLVHKIIDTIMEDSNSNSIEADTNSIGNYIGYLQLLIAIITLGIGGIALINFVTSREALREIRDKNEKGLEEVQKRNKEGTDKLRTELNARLLKLEKTFQKASNLTKQNEGSDLSDEIVEER